MNMFTSRNQTAALRHAAWLGMALAAGSLTACGGGSNTDAGNPAADSTLGTSPVSTTTPAQAPLTTGPGAAASLNAASTCNLPSFQTDLLQQINAARAAGRRCGATAFAPSAPLVWDTRLFAAAEGHSRDMATNNYFSHTSLDGRIASRRVTDAGYAWRATGENIAAGQRDVSTVMNGWLASEGHCSNLMNPGYQDVAVACVQQAGSTYGRYWTMVLARP